MEKKRIDILKDLIKSNKETLDSCESISDFAMEIEEIIKKHFGNNCRDRKELACILFNLYEDDKY